MCQYSCGRSVGRSIDRSPPHPPLLTTALYSCAHAAFDQWLVTSSRSRPGVGRPTTAVASAGVRPHRARAACPRRNSWPRQNSEADAGAGGRGGGRRRARHRPPPHQAALTSATRRSSARSSKEQGLGMRGWCVPPGRR